MNVKFYFGTSEKFKALTEKDALALYFLEDVQQLWKGDKLFATGANASNMAAGLMSIEDKIKLDELFEAQGKFNLSSTDGSIVVSDADDGKTINVAISTEAGNVLIKKSDGLYVDSIGSADLPAYSIEKQATAEGGAVVSYKLKKTVGESSSYVGDTINIPKDLVVQSGSLKFVTQANAPYDGAVVNDPYLELVLSDAESSCIYIPVKDLVDVYVAGDGISIESGVVNVNIADSANGLQVIDGSMSIALATKTSAGAMSAADKVIIDSIASTYATIDQVNDLEQTVNKSIIWGEL